MSNIKLLDCTLRDGGYVNQWNFGNDAICNILKLVFLTKVDIIEAGFIRNVLYDQNKVVFSELKKLDKLMMDNKIVKGKSQLAVMAEIARPLPLDMIEPSNKTDVDIIRVIVWKTKHTPDGEEKDVLAESLEYCKGIVQKGYKVCVQPNRTDQYSDEEFINMLNMFSEINPYAIYVVDSWGTMYSNQVLHYMRIADHVLPKHIRLGFHGHNNMMQTFSAAEKIVECDFEREIILDASIDGIGRGAGNLNLELIARYLNHEKDYSYNLDPIYEIYDSYIKPLRDSYFWGSSLPFLLSADQNANPSYVLDFLESLTTKEMSQVYKLMDERDKILYTAELAEQYMRKVKG